MLLDLLDLFEGVPYFTINGFRQVLNDGGENPQRARELLSRWARAGHIIRLKRGVYMTRRFYETRHADADFTSAICAVLQPINYVSLEHVLQRGGVLTEATYPVTAITTKNTQTIQNQIGSFVYRHLKLPLYTGYKQKKYYGMIFHRASIAKALFDYLYLRPLPRLLRSPDLDISENLRLNLDDFSEDTIEEFESYIKLSASEKMNYIRDNLRRNAWQP